MCSSYLHITPIDVLKLTYKDFPEKLSETLVLTVAALTKRFMKLPGNGQHKVRLCSRTVLLLGLCTGTILFNPSVLLFGHCMVMNAFKGIVNLKPLPVGKWLEFKPHSHLWVKVWWLLHVPPFFSLQNFLHFFKTACFYIT